MNGILLAIAGGPVDVEWGGTLVIVDWGATFALLGFLAAGFFSLRIVRDPLEIQHKHGTGALILMGMVPAAFILSCIFLGLSGLVNGVLPTPNGVALTDGVACAGGAGFVALATGLAGIFLWRLRLTLHSAQEEGMGPATSP
jgi:hypothetical protein